MLSPPSSTSALTPKRRLSVDSQTESLEEVQEISTPSISPSDSTVSKETEKFVPRTSPKGKAWKENEDSPPISYHSCNSAEGETDDTYQEQKKRIGTEWKKSKKDYNLLRDLMVSTFPMGRRDILTKNLRV